MEGYFVLDERGEPVEERDFGAWTRWFEQADRRVARTVVTATVTVLTTFSGVDHSAGSETPKLFETRVFGGVLDGEETRHATKAAALLAHELMAEWCRRGEAPDYGITADDIAA